MREEFRASFVGKVPSDFTKELQIETTDKFDVSTGLPDPMLRVSIRDDLRSAAVIDVPLRKLTRLVDAAARVADANL